MIEITVGDYIIPFYVSAFDKPWEDLGAVVVETYSLTAVTSIQSELF